MAKTVTVETENRGNNFATVAVVRDAKTNRKLATTGNRPYGNAAAAMQDAESLIAAKGWRLAESE